ncbi:MAG TPA: hypothetical protein VLH77_01595, partial [Gammaproteobacteria bacterium]|nr:hypothetical protein [Gammaproteobacteria bacterium]
MQAEEEEITEDLTPAQESAILNKNGFLAFIFQGIKVNFSYMYDGISIYPKDSCDLSSIHFCLARCEACE